MRLVPLLGELMICKMAIRVYVKECERETGIFVLTQLSCFYICWIMGEEKNCRCRTGAETLLWGKVGQKISKFILFLEFASNFFSVLQIVFLHDGGFDCVRSKTCFWHMNSMVRLFKNTFQRYNWLCFRDHFNMTSSTFRHFCYHHPPKSSCHH